MEQKKVRNWCFTLNNPTEEEYAAILKMTCKYLVVGKEVAPTTGTPHLQGQIVFTCQRYFGGVKELFPSRTHIEPTMELEASIIYCKKEGNFVEVGKCPVTNSALAQREKWTRVLDLAKSGKIDEIDPCVQVTQCRNLEYIQDRENSKRKLEDTTETNYWCVGASGTGKSRWARETFGDSLYLKLCNKWWCHYQNEETVLIEDFDGTDHKHLVHFLKIWADRYPFTSEGKNRTMKIRPKRIIVTSNWSPEEIWDKPQDLEPILRRFVIKRF